MNKPIKFTSKINIKTINENDNKYDFLNKTCKEYGFIKNLNEININYYEGSDNDYNSLKSRMIFLLKLLKKENILVIDYQIYALVYDNKVHGILV